MKAVSAADRRERAEAAVFLGILLFVVAAAAITWFCTSYARNTPHQEPEAGMLKDRHGVMRLYIPMEDNHPDSTN